MTGSLAAVRSERATDAREALSAATMIADPDEALDAPAPRFHRTFDLDAPVRSATLVVTSLGTFSATLNRLPVSDDVLAPGWTDYRHRLIVEHYDVAALLRVGANVIDIVVGNGWYRGRLGRPARRDLYGDRLGVIAQLDVTFLDGTTRSVGTDASWAVSPSGVIRNDLYDGSVVDLRRNPPSALHRPEPIDLDRSVLVDRTFPPVRTTERREATSVVHRRDGSLLIDFGQNLVGWVRIELTGSRTDQHVIVRHAEVERHGVLETRPLRDARATDEYLLDHRDGDVVLEPRFTFHGFRYATIDGVEPEQVRSVEAIVVGSDLSRTGWFDSSEPLLDRFHENVVWSMRGNMLSVPMDCPQRDERLGWTADIQVFAPTALFLADAASLLRSWLEDLYMAQGDDGSVPVVVPDIYRRAGVATAGWGDAVTIIPWELYQHDGDLPTLERAFEPMRRWVDHVARIAGPDCLWVGGHQYGDWLDPSAPPDDPAAAMTDRDLVATAYFHRSTRILADTSELLGRSAESRLYGALADRIRAAFQATFVTRVGRLTADTPAAYALTICFGLLDEEQRIVAGARLADLVRRANFTISTGFLGTPIILDALRDTGNERVAMRLLMQTEQPSWLYPVTVGATTVWERWDSLLADGEVNPGEMTSFNHYALGAVADWMHRALGGLTRVTPGWSVFTVRPPVWSGLRRARTRFDSPAGRIECDWSIDDGVLSLDVLVPAGTEARVELPDRHLVLGPGRHELSAPTPDADCAGRHLAARTVREAIDDAPFWTQVLALIGRHRPEWSTARIASAAWPYLDRPLPDLARCIGMSIPTREEEELREQLARLADQSWSPSPTRP